jgi:RPA family protein
MTGKQFAREVAKRLFALELKNSVPVEKTGTDEFEPKYVLTELGEKVNRVFVSGVLTEIENVGEENIIRARIVDTTNVFFVYAGNYQPEARSELEKIKVPAYVSIIGKVNTYKPAGVEAALISIRPESVTEIDEKMRNKWVAETSRLTLERVSASKASETVKQTYIDLANTAMRSLETAS